jgi:chloramphenicol-sensitive protein RarD
MRTQATPAAAQETSLAGILYAIGAMTIWGVLPVYWKLCSSVPSIFILSHRVFWSFLLIMGILLLRRNGSLLSVFRNRRQFTTLCLSGILIGVNWLTYIFAVNSDRIVESSLGYYINPLFNILLGLIFLRERLSKPQIVSFILVIIGVLYQSISYGRIPYIAIVLTLSFGFYSLLKKKQKLDSLTSLGVETMVLTPFVLCYSLFQGLKGAPVFGNGSPLVVILAVLSGVVTTVPLFFFSEGAKRIPLSTMAFIQYVSPTMMLLIGVLVYGEPFTRVHLISFSLIWAALIISGASISRDVKRGD